MSRTVSTHARQMQVFAFIVVLGVVALPGCGKHQVNMVPVRGRITLDGGEWPTAGLVTFAPKEPAAGYPRRAGHAVFKPDGTFQATTIAPGDGLIPGTYLVNLRCVSSSSQDITKGVDHVPQKYQRGETSGFEVIVPADDSKAIEINFDVPKAGG